MTDSLRDRIAAVLDKALPGSAADVGFYQRLGVTPLVDIEAYDLNLESLADAVIEALGPIPNRSFIDDRNNRWEWCGGEPGMWAWLITRIGPEPLHIMYPRNPEGYDCEPF